MTMLEIPDRSYSTREGSEIQAYLKARGIVFERWAARVPLTREAGQAEVLAAYAHALEPYMKANGYRTADVIRVHPDLPNLDQIRGKFLEEHTHEEDEVRFFVEGKGAFWFNLEGEEPVFSVVCEAGDLIGVPSGTKHWFDMGREPLVTAIRVFTNEEGWVPVYTGSGLAARYNKPYEAAL